MFTGIVASGEDTHSLESLQESEPLMIQQASVDCADHMVSPGFTPELLESMSTDATEDEELTSLSHKLRKPNPQGINVIV
ncbi:hypothetical protein DPMN_145009 [Dreissena polymorpha]|uniref:Uncharacterized protein n=1 Tax=Dreissena polymorpha TaxID=45954 RepID=A0A9D4F545_DREPO|nr:hypothetical protein DPMN_145009 [Dreissena polymorpha]